jgi:hypothetical protein
MTKFSNYNTLTSALLLFAFLFSAVKVSARSDSDILSPDKKIKVKVEISPSGNATYSIIHSGTEVVKSSKLGIIREDENFSTKLSLISVSSLEEVKDNYVLFTGKRRNCTYLANKKIFHLKNAAGKTMDVIFQVSNDGVAFRYYFPDQTSDVKRIKQEVTSFHFDTTTLSFLHPCPNSKTGWEKTQPSYEEHYVQGQKVGKPAPYAAGWVFPALYNYGKYWVALTEAGLERNYCASRLCLDSPAGEYSILFPQATEGIPGAAVYPESTLPWYTPWRVLVVTDNLSKLMESTLGTDLATPAKYDVSSWLKTGQASWSWIIKKDNSIVYDIQKAYIDYAAEMKWGYCLVDADWNFKIGYDKIKELADYAKTKNVALILWYNSAGNWNTVKYQPKDLLLTHESRMAEFQRISAMGIAGIKVDFFGGDGQSMIAYYQDILEDAAANKINVNFHGATLPRGWARTYPNLVTTEAVMGFEYITFLQKDADHEPNHCCMLPFTRNLFDPMDFTPVNFSGIPKLKRATTVGFEIALSVVFLSGVQHLADTPEGMAKQPDYVKEYMRSIPGSWDEVKFLDGYPGKFIVIARRSGNNWYIAGMNGEKTERTVTVNLSFVKGTQTAQMITDAFEGKGFAQQTIELSSKKPLVVKMIGTGGFVVKL